MHDPAFAAGSSRYFGRAVKAAGKVKLAVKAKGKAKKKLNRKGKAKVKLTITFTPTNGSPAAQAKTVNLRKKLRR